MWHRLAVGHGQAYGESGPVVDYLGRIILPNRQKLGIYLACQDLDTPLPLINLADESKWSAVCVQRAISEVMHVNCIGCCEARRGYLLFVYRLSKTMTVALHHGPILTHSAGSTGVEFKDDHETRAMQMDSQTKGTVYCVVWIESQVSS